MAKLNDDGSLDYGLDQWQQDDPDPRKLGVTDPKVESGGVAAQPPGPAPSTAPTGGNIDDPAYLDAMLSWYGKQPGVNPSVTNDPDYWRGAVKSGRFKGDEQYLIKRFFTPEGPPEGTTSPNQETPVVVRPNETGQIETPTVVRPNETGQLVPDSTTTTTTGTTTPSSGGGVDDFIQQLLAQQKNITSQRQGVLDRLRGLADDYGKPVTADDLTIKGVTDAYHGTTARSLARYQSKAAERAYAEGVPTGAFDAQLGNAEMSAGRDEGTLQAQMIKDETLSRRDKLMQVLQGSGNILSAEDASQMQRQVAAIDASLGQQGVDLSNRSVTGTLGLGQQSLDLQKLLGMSSLDLQRFLGTGSLANQTTSINNQKSLGDASLALQKLLGLGALDLQKLGITNQNSQFYDQFGEKSAFDAAQLEYLYKVLGLKT